MWDVVLAQGRGWVESVSEPVMTHSGRHGFGHGASVTLIYPLCRDLLSAVVIHPHTLVMLV